MKVCAGGKSKPNFYSMSLLPIYAKQKLILDILLVGILKSLLSQNPEYINVQLLVYLNCTEASYVLLVKYLSCHISFTFFSNIGRITRVLPVKKSRDRSVLNFTVLYIKLQGIIAKNTN
jgi:hypothetical protein